MIINNIEGDLITVGNSEIFVQKNKSNWFLLVNNQLIKMNFSCEISFVTDVIVKDFLSEKDRALFSKMISKKFYNSLYGSN